MKLEYATVRPYWKKISKGTRITLGFGGKISRDVKHFGGMLTEGRGYTRFFYEKALNRKQRNTILGVMDESDTWHEIEDKIVEIITSYCQKLFVTSQPVISPEFLDAIQIGVTL